MSTTRSIASMFEFAKVTTLTNPIDNSTDSDSEESANIRKKNAAATAASKDSEEVKPTLEAAASASEEDKKNTTSSEDAPAPAPSPASSTPPSSVNIRTSVLLTADSSEEDELPALTDVEPTPIVKATPERKAPSPTTSVVRKEKSGSSSASQGSESEEELDQAEKDAVVVHESPFHAVHAALKRLRLHGIDHNSKPQIKKHLFFIDVLMLVKKNLNTPEIAIDAIKKKVQKAEDNHLEKKSASWDDFYNIIARLHQLDAQTLVAQYTSYLEKTADMETLLDALIQHCVVHTDNHFSKLHVYLQTKSLTPKKNSKQERKLNDFIKLLAAELREENPAPAATAASSASDADDNPEMTITELQRLSAPLSEFSGEISEITKLYNTNFFGGFTGYRGAFKNLMQALHTEKPQTMAAQRKAYQTLLEKEAQISDFAKSIQTLVLEHKQEKTQKSTASLIAAKN